MSYRDLGREHLEEAKRQMAAGSIRYACLELRCCLECLAYERLDMYCKDDAAEMVSWKPNEVMRHILLIDDAAEAKVKVTIGDETTGTASFIDERFSKRWLSTQYNSLSNLIHTPTVKSMRRGKGFEEAKALRRCREVIERLDVLLSDDAGAVTFISGPAFTCICKTRIQCSALDIDGGHVTCGECSERFNIIKGEDGRVAFAVAMFNWTCTRDACRASTKGRLSEIADGLLLRCQSCGGLHRLQEQRWTLTPILDGEIIPAEPSPSV